MLAASLLLGLLVAPAVRPGIAAALVGGALAAFVAQDLWRRRAAARGPALAWRLVTTSLAVLAGLALAAVGGPGLLVVGALGLALGLGERAAKRARAFTRAELVGVLGLALPAAAAVLLGDPEAYELAALVYGLLAAVFVGSVLAVRARMADMKRKGGVRRPVQRAVLGLHLALAVVAVGCLVLGQVLATAALLPVVGRGVWVALMPPLATPSFRTLGLMETGITAWFVVLGALALRAGL